MPDFHGRLAAKNGGRTFVCSAAWEHLNALSLVQGHSSPPLPLAMASEVDSSAPTVTVNNGEASVVNGSADVDVIPNGNVVSMDEVMAPPVHDQVANAGTVQYNGLQSKIF